jgi:hypothetical protein
MSKAADTGAQSMRYGDNAAVIIVGWLVIDKYREAKAQSAITSAKKPITVRATLRIFANIAQYPSQPISATRGVQGAAAVRMARTASMVLTPRFVDQGRGELIRFLFRADITVAQQLSELWPNCGHGTQQRLWIRQHRARPSDPARSGPADPDLRQCALAACWLGAALSSAILAAAAALPHLPRSLVPLWHAQSPHSRVT